MWQILSLPNGVNQKNDEYPHPACPKKMIFQKWDEPRHHAFAKLRNKLYLSLVLKFPEFDKSFELHTYGNDFASGKL
jgi:hypothetical protein